MLSSLFSANVVEVLCVGIGVLLEECRGVVELCNEAGLFAAEECVGLDSEEVVMIFGLIGSLGSCFLTMYLVILVCKAVTHFNHWKKI